MTAVPPAKVFPVSTKVNGQGHLTIGGCDVVDLVAEFGTPLYVYDEATLKSQAEAFSTAFKSRHADSKVLYACKAFINVPMARLIQERVREVTDRPILYLVNSNYHGDHTFGNCAFPEETLIVQHRRTAALVPFFAEEKEFMLPCVGGDPAVFEGVTLRPPDIAAGDYLRIDLGGREVELHHFGPANTPGDTITYVPEARAAWTGNMTGGNLIVALESDAPAYMDAIARFARKLEVETLIPAHNPISGAGVLDGYLIYLGQVTRAVRRALSDGWSLPEAMEGIPLDMDQPYSPPADHPRIGFFRDLHAYNVQITYRSLAG